MKKLLVVLALIVTGMGTAAAQSKVAHVDSQKLLDTMPSRKEAVTKLNKFQSDGEAELKEMEDEIAKLYDQYDKTSKDMTPFEKQAFEKKIMDKQQRYQARSEELNQQLQTYSNQLNAPILERVKKAIEIVSDRKKLSYVMDISVVLYYKGGMDITSEVITELLKLEATSGSATSGVTVGTPK